MYTNLEEILKRKSVTKKALADLLNISEKSLFNKMMGRTEFTLSEATKICSTICPEYRMEFVFQEDDAA